MSSSSLPTTANSNSPHSTSAQFQLSSLTQQIAEVQEEIKEVKQEIKEATEEAKRCNSDDKSYWRDKESKLRDKENKLRDQLNLLLQQQQQQQASALVSSSSTPQVPSSSLRSLLSSVHSWFFRSAARSSDTASVPSPSLLLFNADGVSFTRSVPNYWRQCGRVETKKKKDDHDECWSSDGQCVVVHPQLLLTAAHVCFYDSASPAEDDENISRKAPRTTIRTATVGTRAGSAAAGAMEQAGRVDHRHSAKYAPFEGIRAVFVEPQLRDGRIIGKKEHIVECELMRYSDSMDAAILRVVKSSINLVPSSRLMRDTAVTPRIKVALIAFKNDMAPSPHEIPGEVLYVEERTKKHGSGGEFLVGETDYQVQGGFSGGAVLHRAGDGVWELVGIHTGTDFKRFDEAAAKVHQGKRARTGSSARSKTSASGVELGASSSAAAIKSFSAMSMNPGELGNTSYSSSFSCSSSLASRSRTSDGSISYDPSDEEDVPEVSWEESGHALIHTQTNTARATFVVAERILQREHWSIDYVLALPSSAAGASDSSPPRVAATGTSARNIFANARTRTYVHHPPTPLQFPNRELYNISDSES